MSASPRVRIPLALGLLGLLAACASAPKPPPAPVPAGPVPEGPVTLRFGWSEGLTAQVSYTTSRLRTGEATESGDSRYRMVVRGAGDVLKVVSENVELSEEQQQALAATGPVSIPTVVVGREGEFLRIEGADEVLAKLGKLLEAQGHEGEEQARLLGMLRAAMEEGAKETWHLQVGGWRGLTLEPGKPVTRPARLSPPTLANVDVPVTESLTYEGAVPCTEGETEKRCVRLTLQAKPVESELPKVKAAFLEQVKVLSGGQEATVELEELGVAYLTELVTEPGTLIPHRVRTSRRTRVVFLADKEQRTEDDQREEVEYVFVYPAN